MGEQKNPIIGFYDGTRTDARGRWLSEILSWDFGKLEAVHDYIQWLFPLRKRSAFNSQAPVLDQEAIAEFHARPELRAALVRSLELMLGFYGYKLAATEQLPRIVKSDEFRLRASEWMTPGNHNHLRITRILGSLRVLGCEPYAENFFRAPQEVYWSDLQKQSGAISDDTFSFWRSAAGIAK